MFPRRQRDRQLELRVAHAIDTTAELEKVRRESTERAARMDDIRAGVLALHQPHAQARPDDGPPELFCTECAADWPCKTVQFVYRFGEFAREPVGE